MMDKDEINELGDLDREPPSDCEENDDHCNHGINSDTKQCWRCGRWVCLNCCLHIPEYIIVFMANKNSSDHVCHDCLRYAFDGGVGLVDAHNMRLDGDDERAEKTLADYEPIFFNNRLSVWRQWQAKGYKNV